MGTATATGRHHLVRSRTWPSTLAFTAALALAGSYLPAFNARMRVAPSYVGPDAVVGTTLSILGRDRRTLSLSGPIGPGAARIVDAAIARAGLGPGDAVLLDSSGGIVGQAEVIGSALRRRGLMALVAHEEDGRLERAFCASACTIILAGGAERAVVQGSAVVAHAIQSVGAETGERSAVQRGLDRYLAGMGIGEPVRSIVRDEDRLTWLTNAQLLDSGLSTAVVPAGPAVPPSTAPTPPTAP